MKEQSGIFAGDGGYTIDIAGHSYLESGLVTSTRQAESQGLNRFKTGTLSYGDIANHANYCGSAMSMEGQITLDGQGGPKKSATNNCWMWLSMRASHNVRSASDKPATVNRARPEAALILPIWK